MKALYALVVVGALPSTLSAQDAVVAPRVDVSLDESEPGDQIFAAAPEQAVALMAQPMMPPRPAETTTPSVKVRAVHDGKWLALRVTWVDAEKSEGGRLGEQSDAVAVQFPKSSEGEPPPVFMGLKGQPVHIMHWRAQYQRDREVGRRDIRDLYPNTGVDHHPFEYKSFDGGSLSEATAAAYGIKPAEKPGFWASLFGGGVAEADAKQKGGYPEEVKEIYLPGRAAGNPQSHPKASSVDDIVAEGFGTSQVLPDPKGRAKGVWAEGTWTVTIVRPLDYDDRSKLAVGKPAHMGLAVWQGGKLEVGSRKSVTMNWIPLQLLER